ncbi:MAG: hypothetical protein IM568_14440 [Flavobacterium sp.]|nr:hypothetical protein [Flavobacterium sp.]
MADKIIKEKRLYFLFSKLNGKQSDKTHFTLVLDTFLNNGNNFLNLFEISQKLIEIGINIKPEALEQILLNKEYKPYFELPDNFKIETPFKIKSVQYNLLSSYKNYYIKLDDYIINFLKIDSIDNSKAEIVKEILLTTLFRRNLTFLKQLITSKDANDLEEILVPDKNGHYSIEDCRIYNSMILNSNSELNEIIKVLLYKIFDFLKLHYNPNVDKTLNETYKNKVFYLDSSFIIRLFGFDNELREHRTLELIGILKKIEGVKFLVHSTTVNETQINVKNLIDKVQKLLNHSDESLLKFDELSNKKNDTINLYLRLKQKGKITGKEDFLLHFNNVLAKLKSIIGDSIQIDDKKITYSIEKFDNLIDALSLTEKSNSRINHISKLLLFIDSLREANNYNIYDIKYWLITTDGATLKIDGKIRTLNEDNSKSVCILPTELLRTISNRSEISADYIEVFKQFMIYSNAFIEDYTEKELEVIDKVITLAEKANNDEYDVDYYITNLFDEISLKELMGRLSKIEEKEKEDLELVKIFEETFGGAFREKYFKLIEKRERFNILISIVCRYLSIFILPILILIKFLSLVFNSNLVYSDPLTYINVDNWSKLEFVFSIIEIILIPFTLFINVMYGLKFQKWILKKISLKA